MKLVWKNQAKGEGGGKKRSRSQPISLNPNLPFGAEEGGGEDGRNSDGSISLAIGSREDDPRKLVESFQSLGNQLAEVCAHLCLGFQEIKENNYTQVEQ